jgi:hypothetical protein
MPPRAQHSYFIRRGERSSWQLQARVFDFFANLSSQLGREPFGFRDCAC